MTTTKGTISRHEEDLGRARVYALLARTSVPVGPFLSSAAQGGKPRHLTTHKLPRRPVDRQPDILLDFARQQAEHLRLTPRKLSRNLERRQD